MPIIRVRDEKNNRWKRNTQKKEQQKRKVRKGVEAIVKEWEL